MFVISLSFRALFALFSLSFRALAELLPRSVALLSCYFRVLAVLFSCSFQNGQNGQNPNKEQAPVTLASRVATVTGACSLFGF